MNNFLFKKGIALLVATVLLICALPNVYADNMALKEPLVDYDFEQYEVGSNFMVGKIAEYEGSKALKLQLNGPTELKFDSMTIGETAISFDLAATAGSFSGVFSIQTGGPTSDILVFNGDGTITTKMGKMVTRYTEKFKKFVILFDPDQKSFSLYVDGRLIIDRGYVAATDKVITFSFPISPVGDSAEVYLDNILAYPTYEKVRKGTYYNPNAKPVGTNKTITLTSKTTIPSDTAERNIMKGRIGVHMRSGVVYANDKKYVCKALPYYKESEYMVPGEVFENGFGAEVKISEDKITIGGKIELNIGVKSMSVSGRVFEIEQAPEVKDGVLYLPLKAITEKGFGKSFNYNDTTLHFGMIVISDSKFAFPNNAASLQSLNDFLFYERPSKENVLQDYNTAGYKGVHPRLMATQADFERIREEIKTNSVKKRWSESLIKYCDETLLSAPTLKYELSDGVRLLNVSSTFAVWMLSLGMAYKLTGDIKYFDCAWRHLEVISNMPDWNPAHHIDVGVMAFGVAIAYDWFYDEFTPEQRQIVEKGAYNNCLWTVNRAIEDATTPYGSALHENNHNVFVNHGNMAVCLAFMDVYPQECSKVAADIIRILEFFLDKFAPDGQYYEGADYASIAIDYMTRFFSVLEIPVGTLYSLDKSQGIDLSGDYLTNIQSDVGSFNFADSYMSKVSSTGLFWLYRNYNIEGVKDGLANGHYYLPAEYVIPLCLIWYDVSENSGSESKQQKLDVHYDTEEIITMRNSYDNGQVFVGIKAGKTVYAHSHLEAGSFVFDALGKRWAFDLGREDYNLRYEWTNIFRYRPESHNTLLINPDESPGYVLYSEAPVTSYESKPKGVIAKINMTDLYGDNVNSAKRGYFFTDNRRSLVVRDEVSFPKKSDAYWLMYTDALAEIVDENTVILSDKENPQKKLKVEFRSSVKGEIGYEDAQPFMESMRYKDQVQNVGFYRLYYKISCSGDASITAKITPLVYEVSSIDDYNVNIDDWKIPDGDLQDVPQLDSIKVGDENYSVKERYITVSVLDEDSDVLPVTAESEKYNVSVKNASSIKEATEVTVSDKEDPANSTKYYVRFLPRFIKRYVDGYDTLLIRSIEASDEPEPENGKYNVLDGDLYTRWSAAGRQYLMFDLEEEKEFDTAMLSFYLGDERMTDFSIEISNDGENYQSVGRFKSSGNTLEREAYDLGKQKARYIRVNFFGTNTGEWNSPTEIIFANKSVAHK